MNDNYTEETDRQLIEMMVKMFRDDDRHGELVIKLMLKISEQRKTFLDGFEYFVRFLHEICKEYSKDEVGKDGQYPLFYFILFGNELGKMIPHLNTIGNPKIQQAFRMKDFHGAFKEALEKVGVEFGLTEDEELREKHEHDKDAPLMGWESQSPSKKPHWG